MRALVLAHEPDCGAGRIEERLTQRGIDVDTHVVTAHADQPNVAAPFPTLRPDDLLVVMGSVRSLTRSHEIDTWIHDEVEMLRTAHADGIPVLGICFGGQLLAEALGGSVEVAPTTELGWYEIDHGDAPNPIGRGPWFEWHHDRFVAPPGSEVLARTDDAEQLFRIGRSVGTQFHPEVDVAHVGRWLAASDDDYLARYDATRDELLHATGRHEADNAVRCHALVDWFLDHVATAFAPTPTPTDRAAVAT